MEKILTANQIREYMHKIHSKGWDDDSDLRTTPLRSTSYILTDINPAEFWLEEDRFWDCTVDKYMALETEPPPIVIERYRDNEGDFFIVLDGYHRIEVALRKGQTTILAYIGSASDTS